MTDLESYSSGNEKAYQFTIDPENERSNYTWMLRFSSKARSILEIGCSTGFFSQYLVDLGFSVVGIEINPSAAEVARKICKEVVVGDIELADVQNQIMDRFDRVVMGDVLEHLKNPKQVLTVIREKYLNPGGAVVISTPNSGHWAFRRQVLAGRFPRQKFGLFDSTHLQFFTQDTLDALVKESGYHIVERRYSVNFNTIDITFGLLAPLYKIKPTRAILVHIEALLAKAMPTLFGYQFIIKIEPLL